MSINIASYLDVATSNATRLSTLQGASTSDITTLFTTLAGYQSNTQTTGHGDPIITVPSGMSPTLVYDKLLAILYGAPTYWNAWIASLTQSQLNQVQGFAPSDTGVGMRSSLLAAAGL